MRDEERAALFLAAQAISRPGSTREERYAASGIRALLAALSAAEAERDAAEEDASEMRAEVRRQDSTVRIAMQTASSATQQLAEVRAERDALAELARIGGENDEAVRVERDAAVAQAAKMREALDFYGSMWRSPDFEMEPHPMLLVDCGRRARAALAAVEPGA